MTTDITPLENARQIATCHARQADEAEAAVERARVAAVAEQDAIIAAGDDYHPRVDERVWASHRARVTEARDLRERATRSSQYAAELARQRRIGDGNEVRCGDIMHDGTCHGTCGMSRRLCGECCRTVERDGRSEMACETGCGEVLERWAEAETIEPPPGWVDRAVERARREGVLPSI